SGAAATGRPTGTPATAAADGRCAPAAPGTTSAAAPSAAAGRGKEVPAQPAQMLAGDPSARGLRGFWEQGP
ncbi:hypothetical protein UNPF46_23535, partial [Bradyrhizobium sp. UNPF46]